MRPEGDKPQIDDSAITKKKQRTENISYDPL